MCKGTPFEARVEALKRADPEADANAQAARGSFRLLRFTPEDSECSPRYPRSFEAKCSLMPETTVVEHQKPYREAFAPLWKVLWRVGDDSPPDAHCATVYGTLIEDYVSRFNRALIEHSRYPHKDLCRHVPFKGDWNAFWEEQGPRRKLTEQPKAEDIPSTYDGLPTAARFGDADAVRRYLAQGIKPDDRDDWHMTALEWSVIRGYDDVFRLLLNLPGNPGQEFCAALEDALFFRRHAMLDALVPLCARQPGPAAANDRNRLINHVAGRGDIAFLKAMVAAGFSIDAGPPAGFQERDPDQEPDEEVGPYRPLDQFKSTSRKAIATTLLHAAAAKGDIAAAELFLKLGAGINRPGGLSEVTPIYAAIGSGQPVMVDYLLGHGAKLDSVTKLPDRFSTPIHFAIERGHVHIIPILVRHGADLNQVARNGQPALFFALTHYRPRATGALAALLQFGANPNVQSEAPAKGSLSAKIPLKRLDMLVATGRTAIMHAITESHVVCGNWTFAGAPSKIEPRASTDCVHKGIPHIELLLAHGARLDMTDADGLTALHYAARTDYGAEIAELLLSKGADVNARDNAGRTPLDLAREMGLERMPPLLIRHGGKSGRDLRQ